MCSFIKFERERRGMNSSYRITAKSRQRWVKERSGAALNIWLSCSVKSALYFHGVLLMFY